MIVSGSNTRQAALEMIERYKKVYYSDKNLYSAVVSSSEELDLLIQRAFDRGDIAIVAREKGLMELYTVARREVLTKRRQHELKQVREFVRSHPKEVAKVVQRNQVREERIRALGISS